MIDLTQQLEDKKKGCGVDIGGVPCGEFIAHTEDEDGREWGKTYYCKHCHSEIAILEQAIAEIKKQRQEILDILQGMQKLDIYYDKQMAVKTLILAERYITGDIPFPKQQLNQPKTEQ